MPPSLLLRCEHCGAGLRVAAGRLRPGATATCPRCRKPIRIPDAPGAPAVEEIQCQVCGAMLRLRSDRRPPPGSTARCPRCGSAVHIPGPAAAPAAGVPRPAAPAAPAPSRPAAPFGFGDAASAPDGLPAGISAPRPPLVPPAIASTPSGPHEDRTPGAGLRPPARPGPPEIPAGPRPVPVAPEEEETPAARVAADEEEPEIEIQGDAEEAPRPALEPTPAPARPAPAAPPAAARPSGSGALPAFWTVEIGGETLRPGGVATLRLWARQGKLQARDRVRRGEGPWQEAHELPELASIFARQRPAAAEPAAPPRSAAAAHEIAHGWLAGLVGGTGALVPVLGLLIFSGEFERVSAEWRMGEASSATLLCAGVLLTGLLIGRALAALQVYYEGHGEVANIWSAGGAGSVGLAAGFPCGLAALAFWPHSGTFTLLVGFSTYGAGVAFLVLISYRSLFLKRRT